MYLKKKTQKPKLLRLDSIIWIISLAIPVLATFASIVSFKSSTGPLEFELAVTPQQQVQGLSNRKSMPDNRGMLFVFDHESEQCMWMKNMKFSLDMIWLNESKQIVKIAKDISPGTYPRSFCAGNTKYVVEVNSGVAERNNWKLDQQLGF